MLNIPGPKPENRGAELQILLSSPALLLCSSWLPSIEDLSCSSELFTQFFFFSSKSPLDLQVVISQNTGLQISENWVFDLDLRCSSDPCSSLQFLPQEPLNLPWILHLQIFKAAAGPPSSSNLWIFKKQISWLDSGMLLSNLLRFWFPSASNPQFSSWSFVKQCMLDACCLATRSQLGDAPTSTFQFLKFTAAEVGRWWILRWFGVMVQISELEVF